MIRVDKYELKIYRLDKVTTCKTQRPDNGIDRKILRADKDGDGEISREDWFTALTKAGVEITK